MSGPSPARAAALVALRRIEQRRGYSNRILGEVLEQRATMDPRDRGLATTLVYGVLRHRTRLDALIDGVAHKPKKIKGELREILRMAAFEIRELERPVGIAASEALALARRIDRRGALRGLVSGLVSGVAREGARIDAELESAPAVDALERRWSIPRWLAARWVEALGDARALARGRALASPPSVDLRIDPSRPLESVWDRLRRDHPRARFTAVEGQPQCVRTRGAGDVFYGPLHDEGAISVQSLGSQQAARLLAPAAGERVLDACAGMGTKTLQMAELMGRRGEIVAVDSDARKLEAFGTLRDRGGLDVPELELTVIHGDAANLDGLADLGGLRDLGSFDAILVDAPCSGLGDLARHPELRWRVEPSAIEAHARRQDALLRAVRRHLRPGGRLVYAVCSLEPEEGAAQPLVCEPAQADLVLDARQTWTPEEHATDGFFCARWIARDGADAGRGRR